MGGLDFSGNVGFGFEFHALESQSCLESVNIISAGVKGRSYMSIRHAL